MIQTRKVQYQCMSKLSPHELASRAHQFLAEGEKRLVGHRKSAVLTSNTGMSMKLIKYYMEVGMQIQVHPLQVLAPNLLFKVAGK